MSKVTGLSVTWMRSGTLSRSYTSDNFYGSFSCGSRRVNHITYPMVVTVKTLHVENQQQLSSTSQRGWTILCSIKSVDTLVTFVMQLLRTSRWFRRRRAVGFDCAEGPINCPSSSKSSRSQQKLYDNGDEGVHTLDVTGVWGSLQTATSWNVYGQALRVDNGGRGVSLNLCIVFHCRESPASHSSNIRIRLKQNQWAHRNDVIALR